MMGLHKVEYIDLPVTSASGRDLAEQEGEESHPDIQDRGYCVRIELKSDEQLKRVEVLYPRIAALEELNIAFVTYLKEEKHPHFK